jgi:hypothetical protein
MPHTDSVGAQRQDSAELSWRQLFLMHASVHLGGQYREAALHSWRLLDNCG